MKTSKIITWLRDKLPYAPDHAWKNKMQETATMLARLESNLKTAAAQRNEYQEKYLAQREQNTQLEEELKAEMYRHDRYRDYTLGLEQKLEQLKDRHRWIPVTERLPVDWCPVLVTVREVEKPLVGSYRENVWFYEKWNTTFINGAVTHWMPLPEPPKKVE